MTTNTNNQDDILDILWDIETPPETIHSTYFKDSTVIHNIEDIFEPAQKKRQSINRFISASVFWLKYLFTSAFIFSVLLLTTNYSAYLNIAKSYIYEDEIAQVSQSLLNTMVAWEVSKIEEIGEIKEITTTTQERVQRIIKQKEKSSIKEDPFSIKKLVAHLNKEDIDLNIDIIPYENRIVIPRIGKNIPLIDIKEKTVEWKSQLDNIFMKELEDWVVRYPGSAKPGEKWNSFIFGHSSNFPWIAWNYNDVFARLGQMQIWDDVFSYYGQKKYKYKITEKRVISPDDVSILKRNKNNKEITLMTCWPIGTTLNRLVLIWTIVED